MNYLYESAFLEYDYYNRYDMIILLSEHFCHLKDNPIMAFSFINSLIINHKNKLSIFQIVELYELNQKYIYFIQAKEKCNKDYEIVENKNDFLVKTKRAEYFNNYFNSLKISYKIKRIINNYIDNFIKIIENKNIFEESLSFNFDENSENIILVKINYFEQQSNIEENFNKFSSNLYFIIYLLKKEKLYYNNIINYIKKMNFFKDIPIFIIYKYYLFFDIFGGGIVPQEISNKLYLSISRNKNIYDNIITNTIFTSLTIIYNDQNNKNDSKFFALYEYKRDLRIKYFSEECALRLGFKQKDIRNKKIDELMPNEFCKSHQNIIKKLFIGDQLEYYFINKSYLFDSSNTILYSIIPRGRLMYSLSKNLIIISENTFKYENEYIFMLNHNFEILAISSNFIDEYLLDQRIFQLYNLKIMEILNLKSDKILQKFDKDFKLINYNNLLRQIKIEEYFIPQLYAPSNDSNNGMFKYNNFINTKNQIISNISKLEDKDINDTINDINENERLIKCTKIQKEIFDFFINPGKMIFHHKINMTLNKMKFIENIFKELNKIPDNELISNNNNNIHYLITSSKKLFNKLLSRNELSNNYIEISIKFNYYYDKPFYFIIINEKQKLHLNISKKLNFKNSKKTVHKLSSKIINIIDKIPSQNVGNKSTNSYSIKKSFNNINKTSNIIKNAEEGIDEKILIIIKKYKNEIDKERFIFIIKFILYIIIFCIFVVYIIIIIYQSTSIDVTEKILLSYYYNTHTRGIILNIFSKLNGLYLDISGIHPSAISDSYDQAILSYLNSLRDNFHYFSNYYIDYNIAIGHSFNLIYKDMIFYKLRGFWKETPYISNFCSELDFLMHSTYLINITQTPEYKSDVRNFLFYHKKENSKDKIYTDFIKLLFYLTVNFDYKYKNLFNEINDEIYSSYNNYIKQSNIIYYILEIFGLLFDLILFITVLIYLYNSNMIIIKNIIFLFLDFDEESFSRNKNNAHLIKLKLLKFKYLIEDFDLNELQNYIDDLEHLNNYKNDDDGEQINKIDNKTNQIKKNSIHKTSIKKSSLNEKEYQKGKISQKKSNIITIEHNNKINSNYDIKKLKDNNSSYQYLVGIDSKFLENNLNDNSNNEMIANNNLIISNKNDKSNSINENLFKKKSNENLQNYESEIKENYHDIMLNKSNKTIILIIKCHLIIMILFSIVMIFYIVYKIINNTNYNQQSNQFFNDFKIITTRYTYIYYYFITLKSLFIYSEKDPRWNDTLNIMENMNDVLDKSNSDYEKVLKHKMESYNEVEKILNILQYNKNDSLDYISENICQNISICNNYLKSEDTIFNVGIDTGLKNCFIFINNIFMDYKKIKNKTNIEEIVSTITSPQHYEFKKLRKSFSNLFYYVEQKIYSSFENDEISFRKKYKKNIRLLNIISLLLSFLIFLYVFIVIFITINNFTKPIKESTYRICNSFYYIKKYKYNNRKK